MLNSENLETLQKYKELINNQYNRYSKYINDVIDKKQKFNFLYYHSMVEFYKEIKQANIDEQHTQYVTYILDKFDQLPIHKQYIRYLKIKKINDLNDTKN